MQFPDRRNFRGAAVGMAIVFEGEADYIGGNGGSDLLRRISLLLSTYEDSMLGKLQLDVLTRGAVLGVDRSLDDDARCQFVCRVGDLHVYVAVAVNHFNGLQERVTDVEEYKFTSGPGGGGGKKRGIYRPPYDRGDGYIGRCLCWERNVFCIMTVVFGCRRGGHAPADVIQALAAAAGRGKGKENKSESRPCQWETHNEVPVCKIGRQKPDEEMSLPWVPPAIIPLDHHVCGERSRPAIIKSAAYPIHR